MFIIYGFFRIRIFITIVLTFNKFLYSRLKEENLYNFVYALILLVNIFLCFTYLNFYGSSFSNLLHNSLHLTTFCLQYKPTVIACVCIHLACKWSNWEIPVSTDGKHWWEYVDPTVTLELLDGK